MPARDLPSGSSLRATIYWTATSIGFVAGVLIFALAIPVVRLPDSQLPFASAVAGIGTLLFTALNFSLHRSHTREIARYLDRRIDGSVTEQVRHAAFDQVMNLPRFLVAFAFSQFGLVGGGVALALFVRFETFTLQSVVLTLAAAVSSGFLSQALVFTRTKRILDPVRAILAEEIHEPVIRAQLIRTVSLSTKMFIMMAGLTISSALFIAALSQGRASRTIELHATTQQREVLEAAISDLEPPIDPPSVIAAAESLRGAVDMEFLVLDPKAAKVVHGSTGGILDEELDSIRSVAEGSGDSSEFESIHTFAWLRIPGDGRILVATTSLAAVRAAQASTGWFIFGVSAAFVLIAMLIASAASRDLRLSSSALQSALTRITAGDLERGRGFESEDEFGELARSMDEMGESLRGTIRHIVKAADRVESSAREIGTATSDVLTGSVEQLGDLRESKTCMDNVNEQVDGIAEAAASLNCSVATSSESIQGLGVTGNALGESSTMLHARVEEVSSSIEQLSRSIREVASSTEILASAANDTTGGIEEVASALKQIDVNASDASGLSAKVIDAADRGRARVGETIRGMEEIRAATEAAARVVHDLGHRAKQIGAILEVIDDVAEETNLLALNAAIISAQAGERGRGFSVVADEIKDLADRVLANTKEIGGVVQGLQDEAEKAVGAIERGAESVQAGVELSADAGSVLEEITEAANLSGAKTQQIVHAVRSQSAAASHMAELMERISEGVAEIRATLQEQNRNTEHVLESSGDMGAVAAHLQHSATELARSAGELLDNIARVQVASEGITLAQSEQQTACRRANESLEGVQQRAHSNEGAAKRMEDAARALQREAEGLRREVANFEVT